MRNLIFALFAFGAMASQSIAFDVCAGDFLEKYEKELETYKAKEYYDNCDWDCDKMKKKLEAKKGKDAFHRITTMNVLPSYEFGNFATGLISDYKRAEISCGGVSKKLKARLEFLSYKVESFVIGQVLTCTYFKPFCGIAKNR